MKAYLTPLRRNGRRAKPEAGSVDRLVDLVVVAEKGFRHAKATCYYRGQVLGVLWQPVLLQFGEQDFVLSGFDTEEEAAVVQEWRLRPHGTTFQSIGDKSC